MSEFYVLKVDRVEEGNCDELYEDILSLVKNHKASKPSALRYHTMTSIHKNCVIITGGENFKSRWINFEIQGGHKVLFKIHEEMIFSETMCQKGY